jgi:hypothetical protein
LAFRRDDTPPLVKEAQEKMLEVLRTSGNSREYGEKSQEAREVLQDYLTRLETGDLKRAWSIGMPSRGTQEEEPIAMRRPCPAALILVNRVNVNCYRSL